MEQEYILLAEAITETIAIQCLICGARQSLGNPLLSEANVWAQIHVCKM